MRKLKIMPSAYIMLAAMIISNRVCLLLLYFLSAAIHELGHIAAARLFKVEISEIRFTYSGMRICTENKMMSYRSELVVAVAGPLANLFVISTSVVFFTFMGVSLDGAVSSSIDLLYNNTLTFVGALGFIALSSFLQGCLNLLPVRSLDGGRVTYCSVALLFGERGAERVLDILSALSAFVIWTIALYLMLKVSSGLGIYVFSACLFFTTLKKSSDSANAPIIKIK